MRRGLLSPSAIIDVLVDNKSPIFGDLHLNHLHSNHWVWKLIEISTDRCLDIVKAAVSIQNNEGLKQLTEITATTTDMDLEMMDNNNPKKILIIPEAIAEAVDAAAETCRELYTSLVSQLLCQLHLRHQDLISKGQESSQSLETGKLSSLDPRLVSYVSALTRIFRHFHLVETGLHVICVKGTTIPSLTSSVQVSSQVLITSGIDVSSLPNEEDQVIQQAIETLTGPARRIWQMNQSGEDRK
jgi:hypothetical protein